MAYIRKWRPVAMRGDRSAMNNVACAYRILGRHRLAFHWFKKAAGPGEEEDFVDVGYAYQHGLGVRRDESLARQAYRAAIASRDIIPIFREEAMYQLAVLLLSSGSAVDRRAARALLRRADADQDYQQAYDLLRRVESGDLQRICACRRQLVRRTKTLKCPVHKRRAGRLERGAAGVARRR